MSQIPEVYKVKCWLYPKVCRFNAHGGLLSCLLANSYKRYDKINSRHKPGDCVEMVDNSQVAVFFGEVCEWIAAYTAQRISHLQAERDALREAMEKIADHGTQPPWSECAKIARAALKEPTADPGETK